MYRSDYLISPAKRRAQRALLALAGVLLQSATPATAQAEDVTRHAQPANALVMPFDQKNRRTLLMVSNVSGTSFVTGAAAKGVAQPSAVEVVPAVTTHWAFYDDKGNALADMFICLELNDTVVVDPASISAINKENERIGPVTDLTGGRGLVVVTAWNTDAECHDPSFVSPRLVDNALVGRFTLASSVGVDSLGSNAIGLPTDPTGSFTDLPDVGLGGGAFDPEDGFITFGTLRPDRIDSSLVILVALREGGGSGSLGVQEVGPLRSLVKSALSFFDDSASFVSLPDVVFRRMAFRTIRHGSKRLIPQTVTLKTAGSLRMWDLRVVPSVDTPLDQGQPVSCDKFVYAWAWERDGDFSFGSLADYREEDDLACE